MKQFSTHLRKLEKQQQGKCEEHRKRKSVKIRNKNKEKTIINTKISKSWWHAQTSELELSHKPD